MPNNEHLSMFEAYLEPEPLFWLPLSQKLGFSGPLLMAVTMVIGDWLSPGRESSIHVRWGPGGSAAPDSGASVSGLCFLLAPLPCRPAKNWITATM